MENDANKSMRIKSIDAARGFALILMIQQHVFYCLWKIPYSRLRKAPLDYPAGIIFNLPGGLAAPLFIFLAGTGLFIAKERSPYDLIVRGSVIIAAGVILNFIVSEWLFPASWYVLHLIGFCVLAGVFFRRLNKKSLAVFAFLALFAGPAGQSLLNTPEFMNTARMSTAEGIAGYLKIMFFEGQFPVFPWLGIFLVGGICGRFIREKNEAGFIITGLLMTIAGVAAVFPGYFTSFPSDFDIELHRFFAFRAGIFPVFFPTVTILGALAILITLSFFFMEKKGYARLFQFLVPAGRVSLSFLFIHLIIFRQVGPLLGFYKKFSTIPTVVMTLFFTAGFVAAAALWMKNGYKFGLEWLIKLAGAVMSRRALKD
ncbi:MAG: heparan-alpha-glucosaminide N-acetyltransferase domain-containing protein [Fibrobacterota bacterium]